MIPQEINPARLALLFRKEFELCNVQKGETVVLLSDLQSRTDYVQAAFAACAELGADAYELRVNSAPSWVKVGVETIGACKGTVEALKAADLLVCLHIPLFTRWMKEVRAAGTRVLMIIDAPDDLAELMAPPGLREACLYAGEWLGHARTMRVLNDAGMDLAVRCGEYPVMVQYGFAEAPGRFDHWGAGHVHTFPNEGSASGTVVFQPGDMVVLPYVRYVESEVRLEIRDGVIRTIEGGLDARLMRHFLEDGKRSPEDTDPFAVSHLGWGLNPQARWDAIGLYGPEQQRVNAAGRVWPGNFLFSTGPNTQGGGKRDTKGHYDVPMRDCTVLLDDVVVIERGRLVDQRMIVPRVER
jgi:2,5-dihydroxypyridine 5,6-dioxygenase